MERSIGREKQFVGNASHELNTPLTVIMANAQLLEDERGEGNADENRWLNNILQEAEGMKKLVEEMLTLARSEAAKAAGKRAACCFSDVVIESVLSFEAVFYQENQELESDVEEEIWVRGDEGQMKQVLGILLDNAKKYSSPGGRTRVELKRTGGKKARLTVASTGEEIPKEKLEAIFDRFYRLDESRGAREGYGLGLAIAKSIVEGSGGRICAQSEGGQNRFSVELKLRER